MVQSVTSVRANQITWSKYTRGQRVDDFCDMACVINHVVCPPPPLRHQLSELGGHLASLVQLLKVGLEDARDVFAGRDPSEAFSGWDSSAGNGDTQGMQLLDVQAEAIRLDSSVNEDFVRFIQAFLERWEKAAV